MSIIEKLGIENLLKIPVHHIPRRESADYTAVNYEILRTREVGYLKMLEALIECAELIGCFEVNEDRDFNIDQWLLPIIEKAIGKTWEEIKEIIK